MIFGVFTYLFFVLGKKITFKIIFITNKNKRYLPGSVIFLMLIASIFLLFFFNLKQSTLDSQMLSQKQSFFLHCKKNESQKLNSDICSDKYQRERLNELILETKLSTNFVDVNLAEQISDKTSNWNAKNSGNFILDVYLNTDRTKNSPYTNAYKTFLFKKYYDILTQRASYSFLDKNGNDLLITNNKILKNYKYAWAQFLLSKPKFRILQKDIIKEAKFSQKKQAFFEVGKFELFFKNLKTEKFTKKIFVYRNQNQQIIFSPKNNLIYKMLEKLGEKNILTTYSDKDNKIDFSKLKKNIKTAEITAKEKQNFNNLVVKMEKEQTTFLDPEQIKDLKIIVENLKLISEKEIYLRYFQELVAKNDLFLVFVDLDQFWIKIRNILIRRKKQNKYYNQSLLKILQKLSLSIDYVKVNTKNAFLPEALKELNTSYLSSVLNNLSEYEKDDSLIDNYLIVNKNTSAEDTLTTKVVTKNILFSTLFPYFPLLTKITKFRNEGFFYEKNYHSFALNNEQNSNKNSFEKYQLILICLIVLLVLSLLFLTYFYQLVGVFVSFFALFFVGLSWYLMNVLNIKISFITLFTGVLFVFFGIFWHIWFFTKLRSTSDQKLSINRILYLNFYQYLSLINYYLLLFVFAIVFYFVNGIGSLSGPLVELNLNAIFFGWGEALLLFTFVSFLVHVLLFVGINFLLFYSFDKYFKKTLKYFGHSWIKSTSNKLNSRFYVALDTHFSLQKITWRFGLFFIILIFGFAVLYFIDSSLWEAQNKFSIWKHKKWIVSPSNGFANADENIFGINYEHNVENVINNLNVKGIKEVQPLQIMGSKNWFYGLKINQIFSLSNKEFLENAGFVLINNQQAFAPFVYYDVLSTLRLLGIVIGVSMLFFWIRLGLEYALVYGVSFFAKFSLFFIILLTFNLGIDQNGLMFVFVLGFLEMLFVFNNYLYCYEQRNALNNEIKPAKNKIVAPNLFAIISIKFLLFYFYLLALLFVFIVQINNNWWLFTSLLIFVPLLYQVFFVWERKVIFYLQKYKQNLYRKWKHRIWVSNLNSNKVKEGTVIGIND